MNRAIISFLIVGFLIPVIITGCSNDDYPGIHEFVAAFKNPSESFLGEEFEKEIEISFSQPAPESGFIKIGFTTELLYGEEKDFTTFPAVDDGFIEIPILKGTTTTSFQVFKQLEVLPGEEKSIEFEIHSVYVPEIQSFTQGNTTVLVSFSETASLGGTVTPDVGGPNQPNQVYFSLRTKKETKIRRDSWDLGFSSEGFHVKLNSSVFMFGGALEFENIDAVREADVAALKPKMNFLVEGSDAYVDHPDGNPNHYVVHFVSENDAENPVFLIKMGYEIGTETPEPGGVAVAGAERGWKKIRILRRGTDYLLQYADVDSPTHEEVQISKISEFNFTFFRMASAGVVPVEPEKPDWDLNFTTTIEIEDFPEGGMTAYGYSDYVQINNLGNVRAYRVSTETVSYENFSISEVDENLFSDDQRIIGSSWRNTLPPDRRVFTDIFYVVRDAEGNNYKLKFNALENENGIRGYPEFEYQLLK